MRIQHQEEDFSALELEWKKLEKIDETCPIFLRYEWTACWIKHFGEQYETVILTARDNTSSTLIGILPLMCRKRKGITNGEWRFLGDSREICPDHLDVIAENVNKATVTRSFLFYLSQSPKFDNCTFDHVSERSCLVSLASDNDVHDIFWTGLFLARKCFYIPLQDTLKCSKRLIRYERRLKVEFNACFKEASSTDDMLHAFNELTRLHSLRWSQLGQSGAFHDSRVLAFHKSIIAGLGEQGLIKMFFLSLGQRIVSVLYVFVYNNIIHGYASGFDPEFAKYSVGNVLLASALREAIRCNYSEFDFLRGNEHYKENWTESCRPDWRIHYHKKSILGFVSLVNHKLHVDVITCMRRLKKWLSNR